MIETGLGVSYISKHHREFVISGIHCIYHKQIKKMQEMLYVVDKYCKHWYSEITKSKSQVMVYIEKKELSVIEKWF